MILKTRLQPVTRRRRPALRAARRHRFLRLEPLEDRLLLDGDLTNSALSAAQREALISGLQGMATWSETLTSFNQLARSQASTPLELSELVYERNEGQIQGDVAYAARGADFSLFLSSGGVQFGPIDLHDPPTSDAEVTDPPIRMTWLGGNASPSFMGVGQLPGVTSDVDGIDPAGRHTGVVSFERVRYHEVYDGIDLEFYSRGGEPEFDWIIAPGVNPSQITMVYAGMDHLSIGGDGSLLFESAGSVLVQSAPVTFQIVAGQQRGVESSYRLGEGGQVQFALGQYDPSLPLVIDPVLSYSTYLGGTANETAGDIATDAEGNTWVVGTTGSARIGDFETGPAVVGGRAFVTKFDPAGQIVYTTMLGPDPSYDIDGYSQSFGEAVALGPDGSPYVVYLTQEGDYLTFSLYLDLHVTKLSDEEGLPEVVFDIVLTVPDPVNPSAPFGHHPAYHLGVGGFAVDNEGGANLAYRALRPIKTSNGGSGFSQMENFITLIDAGGEVVMTEQLSVFPRAIAMDDQQNLYLTATTSLPDLQVSRHAFQPELNENPLLSPVLNNDVYVAMLDRSFGFLAGTYLGGDNIDLAGGIAVRPSQPGVVYLAGGTRSTDFPLKNALQQQLNQTGLDSYFFDGFVAVLNLFTMELQASTYFGGGATDPSPFHAHDVLSDIALDQAGNVYVVGETNSLDFPVVNPLQATYTAAPELGSPEAGGFTVPAFYDLVIAKFSADLSALEFSTYFGGSGQDSSSYTIDPLFDWNFTGPKLAVDTAGGIHVAGTSKGDVLNSLGGGGRIATDDFPLLNAAQPEFGGGGSSNFSWIAAGASDAVVFAIAQRGTLVGRGMHATAGHEFTHAVAEFTSPRLASASEFTVSINWGDGVFTSGFVTHPNSDSSQYFVHGAHQYDKAGAYPVTVTVTDSVRDVLSPLGTVNVSGSAKSQIGGAIAVDPTNPTRLFAAMTDEHGVSEDTTGGGILVAISDDSGASWSPRLVATADDTVLSAGRGNPDVLFDDFGTLFLAYQGVEGNNIVVAWSRDGGRTFKEGDMHELGDIHGGTGGEEVGHPKLAFGAARNELWVTFPDYSAGFIVAAGVRVDGLGQVGAFQRQTVTNSGGGNFSDIAVGPTGEVAVVWQAAFESAARLRSSVDVDGLGAGIFTLPETVDTSTTDGSFQIAAQHGRVPMGATLAWDTSQGPHRGRLYAAYVDMVEGLPNPPGTPELTLFVTSSDDLGVSWSTPLRVTFGSNFRSMFLPSIAIDPMTGVLAVGWYATAGDLDQAESPFTGFFIATSSDGKTFSNAQRVNTTPSNVMDPTPSSFDSVHGYGLAPGMAFFNGRVYPMWSDNTSLDGGNYSAPQFETVTRIVGVIDVKESLAAIRPIPIDVVRGQSFTKPVATFAVNDSLMTAADFSARISWGDQVGDNSSVGEITQPGGSGTPFVIMGTHTYAEAGAYPVAVAVTDLKTGITTKSVSNVSAQQGSQAQPTIAIDPSNPNRVFAAWFDRAGLQKGIPVATSDDGGVTWHRSVIADGNDGLFLPSQAGHAVFDQFGNLFLTYVTKSPVFHTIVLSSKDGGKVFTLLRRFDDPLAVKPSIAVGPGEGGQGGSVWVTWAHGPADSLTVKVAGAQVVGLDQILSFHERVVAPDTPDGLFRVFGDIAVGPQGQVLVTYSKGVPGGAPAGPAEIMVQLDPDGLGSQPFGPPVRVTDTNVGPHTSIPPQTISAIDAAGSLAWDRSDGEHRGRAYLIYTDAATVGDPDTEILLRYSDNNGATWSAPTSIDNTTKTSFLPSIAVDQSTGNLAMAWYNSVSDAGAGSTSTSFVATLSDDGGESHRVRYVLSPGPSDATSSSITDDGSQFQYGRFTGLAFQGGVFQPIWADNSMELDAVPDPGNFDIASARIAVAEVLRALLVVQTFGIEGIEGQELTKRVATFTDPGGPLASDYSAKINWGDGKPPTQGAIELQPDGSFAVFGTHEYEKLGHYPVSVTIKGHRTKGEGTATAVIADAPVEITIADNLRVIRELEFTKVVGTFTDLNRHSTAADFLPTITWGDGGGGSVVTLELQPGSGLNGAPNTLTITGMYKYLSEEIFTIHVSIRDKIAEKTHDRQGNLISGDPPLVVEPGDFLDIEALEGLNTGDLELVTFKRANDVQVPLDTTVGAYTATINWGDGQVDHDITPFMTSEQVTVVGRHTYASAGEYHPTITLRDDSGGVFSVPLIALVEPDVTSQVSAPKPALAYNPISEQYVGTLLITNISPNDISGPLFVVLRNLPVGVKLDSFPAVDGHGNPILKINQSKLPAGASLPPIELEFSNPSGVQITYSVQVFDGLRPTPVGGASVVFEPNLGQANDAADFIARGQGYAIGLSAGQVTLVVSGNATQAGAAALIELVGANPSPVGTALDPQPGVSNYFLGETAITNVPHFGRVRYSQVYAGIDLEYYGRDGLLEYDWIVQPGADPDSIAVRFGGVDGMQMDSAGNLRLTVNGGGELVQLAPFAYQIVGGGRVAVAAAFDVRGDGTVGFTVGTFDPSLTLVIDPVLVYSTYLGGSGQETARAVAVDAAGNTYVTGTTGSTDFFTVNPFDPELNQPDTSPFGLDFDAFVTKFDAHGVLVYSTYLGGGASGFDPVLRPTTGNAIAIDAAGDVWIGGSTQSLGFPTTKSAPLGLEFNPITGGGFLTRLSADGSSILYSSVIRPAPLDLAVDDFGNVYAAANSVALKLDPATNTLLYLEVFSGVARSIAIDSIGQAYLAGFTTSSALLTKNALFPELHNRQAEEHANPADAFVIKLSTDGDVLFSTYLGGRGADAAYDIAVDDSGVIHVVGYTQSDDLPVPGGLDTTFAGGLDTDGFLIKLANDGQTLLYGTYIGGSGQDQVTGVGVDAQGRTYLSGFTNSTDLPTVRAHQPTLVGEFAHYTDGFAASIAADGGSFAYLTYLGGFGVDELNAVAVDPAGNATFVGRTNSSDLLTRNAAQSQVLGLQLDAFIVRLLAGDDDAIALQNAPFTTVEGNQYNGAVAFFSTNGTETADQFSSIIDWGDGLTSAGTIAGDFHDGFQVFGSHFYADVGAHDVFVTLRDAFGQAVTTMRTGAGTEGRVLYRVAVDTAALAGVEGLLSFQFNPGAALGLPEAEARISTLRLIGGTIGINTISGGVSQISSSEFTLSPSAPLNRLHQYVTLGTRIEFDLEFVGSALSGPDFSDFAHGFALQLLNAEGDASLLNADSSASILRVNLFPDGTTQALTSDVGVTVAASGRATVENAPVSMVLVPFSIQEGLQFNGTVASFTSGNPLEGAVDFTAQIDWGDGSPVVAGVVSGSGGSFTVSASHVYQQAGSYTLVATVTEPDGLEVTAATGRSILAAPTFRSTLTSPETLVSGDFNGDGILDVAAAPFAPVPPAPFTLLDVGVGILLGRGDGSFDLAGFQKTGQRPSQLVVADFNNDGKLDAVAVVVTFGVPAAFELMLGNGDGTLQPPIRLVELTTPAGGTAANIVAADFDRDGKVDLLYTESGTNTLKVARGRGDGTFEAPAVSTTSGGFVYVADMNGDAVPDIIRATSSFGTTALSFVRGLGDGSFDTPIDFASGLPFSALVSDDFDGDGHRDVVASVSSSLNLYRGNGDGTFGAAVQKGVSSAGNLVAADFDRDGRVDLAMSHTGGGADMGRIRVFLNDGVGGFADGISYEGLSRPMRLLTGDFDRDGHIDIAASGSTTVVSVLPGFGDGTFASAVRYASGFSDPLLVDGTLQSVVVSDVNGDSHADAVLLYREGRIVTELGNGDGTFQAVVSGSVGSSFFPSPILTDVNNDGRLDLVAPSGGGIGIVLGSGDGAFPISEVNYSPSSRPEAVVLADFNQDGRLDMAVGGGSKLSVSVFLANADGTFQSAVDYATGTAVTSMAVGDFDGDGILDFAVGGGVTVGVLLGKADGTKADGTFGAPMNTIVGTSPFSLQAVRAGDFNGDGKLDLVGVSFSGSGLVLPGNGDGTFAAALTFTTTGTASRDLAVGDFNGDGKLDIVTAEENTNIFTPRGGLSVLLGNGDGTFQSGDRHVVGVNPTAVTLGDFNRDGWLDIAAANRNINSAMGGTVSILLGNADGTFQNAIDYATTGRNPLSITSGDLNADGILDLAVVNSSGDAAILLGNANGTFQPPINYFIRLQNDGLAFGPKGVAVGDLNGDGKADLVAGNSLLFGDGDGTFPNHRLVTYLFAVAGTAFFQTMAEDIAAGDLNGDGNIDLAVSIGNATAILFGNGNSSFLPPVRLIPPAATGLSTASHRVGLVDMDGDGDLDLVTLHAHQAGGGIAVWRNNGAGTFSAPVVRYVPFPLYDLSTLGPDMDIGDLNGDGFPDVVVTDTGLNNTDSTSSGGVSVMLGLGDGSLAAPIRYPTSPRQGASRVSLADLNRDGRPEIITLTTPIGGSTFRAVAVFTNNGDGTFGPASMYDYGGFQAVFVAAGDFNGDGAADIIVPDGGSNTFNIIFAGDGPALVTDAPVTVVGLDLNPLVGAAFTATVATFTDDNPFGEAGNFTAMIDWGDGQTSTGSVRDNPLGGFEVTGSHTYAASGVFTTTITVRETGQGTHRASAAARVSATDQPLTAAGLVFDAMAQLPFTGVVATFTDANPNGSSGDFSALIHWGDGQSSAGTLAAVDTGGFRVIGTHTYANPGSFPVQVEILDIGGSSATANSTAQVAPRVNQAPVAIGDAYLTSEDTLLVVPAAQGVLTNDTDFDGDSLSAVLIAPPAHGDLNFSADGSFTYLPAANYFGSDSFSYVAHDGNVDSLVSTVTIVVRPVNDGPLAIDDTAETDEDTPVVIHVLSNDMGVDGTIDPTSVVFTSQPSHGIVQADAVSGALTYTPAANFFGSDSLRYKVRDVNGELSNEAVVSITVRPVNDVPVARNDHYVTSEDTPLFIAAASGLLANDTDADGDFLTVFLLSLPAHGTLTSQGDGSFSYVPAADFSGLDSFRYEARDALSASSPVTVLIFVRPVNDVPVVSPITDRVIDEGSLFTGSGLFSDADPNDAWTATVDYGDGTGAEPLALVGTSFALDHSYLDSGEYFATVQVVDRGGLTGLASFKVTVRNLAATVQAGPDLVASEGGLISILANFADPGVLDTHTATVNWGDGTATQSIAVQESGGAGTVFASHSYADDGLYVVTVTVTDEEGASGTDTLTATVGNLAPRVQASPDRTVDVGQLVALPALFTTEPFDAGFDTLTFQALAGSFVDPGALDRHTATIDWGDGTIEDVSVDERTYSPQSLPARTVGFVAGTHRYETSGTFNVLITVTDNAGDAGFDSFTVVVNPPTHVPPILSIAGDSTTSEGELYLLTLSASGPGSDTVLGWTINWGDGTIEPVVGNPPGVTHTYRDGPQTFTISASATTASGTFNTRALTVDVNNVAPSDLGISIASTTISVGGTVSLTGAFSDPGTLDTHTVLINWGDGKTDQVQLAANALSFSQLSHSYLATGSFQGSVRVLDKDGDLSESQLFVINVGGSIHVLNPSFCGALTLSGNASININGPVIVNSSCASKAIAASGNSRIVASRVDVVGGVQLTGNSRISSDPHTGASPSTDPFAAMGAPVGGVTRGSFSCSGKSKQTIPPGVYTKITVSANCELTMQPGEYVIKGSGLSVTGNARVIGAGIMIYNAGSNFPNAGGTFGSIVISGNGVVELTPPSSGPYHGVTIFQARGNSRQFDLAGNAAGMKGVIYAPAARVNLTGNGQLGMTLFVDRLDLNGNAAITLTAADEPPISEPNAVLWQVSLATDLAPWPTGQITFNPTTASAVGHIRNDDVPLEMNLSCAPLQVGINTCTVVGATPGSMVTVVTGTIPGSRYLPQYGVTVAIVDAKSAGQGLAQSDGRAIVQVFVPSAKLLPKMRFQAFELVPSPRTTNIVMVGSPLRADAGVGPGADALSPEVLSAIHIEAIARWQAIGLSATEMALFQFVTIELVDLEADLLGLAAESVILVDVTAAGHGWFVDTTPQEDSEFPTILAPSAWAATPASAASHRIDLLTVIMHELGHFLGREDVFAVGSDELMSAFLPTGIRRLPVAESGITFSPLDVNRDGVISPLDALLVINALNVAGTRQVVTGSPIAAFDVNADGFVSPLDVIVIFNSLNAPTSSLLGEGEAPVDTTINGAGKAQRLAYLADRQPLTSPDATRVLAAETRQSPTRRDDAAWQKFSPCHPGTQEDLLDALAVDDRLADRVESAVDLWFRQLGE